MTTRRKRPVRWIAVAAATIDDPRADQKILRRSGLKPKKVAVSFWVDTDGKRWMNDGAGDIEIPFVPEVTDES